MVVFNNYKNNLEERLLQMHNRKFCVVVNRGTVAIYLAIKALGFENGKIIMPSILCLSPANAIIYAGLTPLYCDVSLTDFNIDINSLETLLKTEPDVRAILLPHIYGQPADIDRIKQLSKKYNVTLIEDAAQAFGGQYKNVYLGSFGDFSILSFGHSKILDAGGIGALLFDDGKYLNSINKSLKMLPEKVNYTKLQELYLKIYYDIAKYIHIYKNIKKLYYSFPYIFKELYLNRYIDNNIIKKILDNLKNLSDYVNSRNEKAGQYKILLQHEKIKHPEYKWHGVHWRYSFLIESKNQELIAKKIREKGIDVSNWYPPVHLYYELEPRHLKNAEYVGNHIFNLWVDFCYNKFRIKKSVDEILKIIDQYG